jgi:hypothetical protein
MFKWLCLGVGSLFLAATLWMVNDIRLNVARSATVVADTGGTINEKLPAIVASSRKAAELINDKLPSIVASSGKAAELIDGSLPDLVKNAGAATEVLAGLAEDIKQLKDLAGAGKERDKNLIAYTNSLLSAIEKTGGKIGMSKAFSVKRGSLKNTRPVAEWVADARREALFLMLLVSTKKDMAVRLSRTKIVGFDWWIEATPGGPSVKLLEWMKENHPETKALSW